MEENELKIRTERTEGTIKCEKCGASLSPDYKACPYCGKKVNSAINDVHWSLIVVLSIEAFVLFALLITTHVMIWSSIRSGAVMIFAVSLMQLIAIPFAAVSFSKNTKSVKSLLLFILLCLASFLLLLIGVFWISVL